MSRDDVIDASEELRLAEEERQRGASGLAQEKPARIPGARPLMILLMLAAVGFAGYWIVKANRAKTEVVAPRNAPAPVTKPQASKLNLQPSPPPLPAPEPTAEPLKTVSPKQSYQTQQAPQQPPPKTKQQIALERRLSSPLSDMSSAAESPDRQMPAQLAAGGGSKSNELEENLKPATLQGAKAGLLKNRDLMLTVGTMMDCGMDNRVVSDQPGMLTCYVTRNVLSTSGRVVLLDAGTKMTGQYVKGLLQGQTRIFVLWTRAETPMGVIVELNSPGAGPLGEGGVGGWVDTHLAERFGGALLLSVVDDVVEGIANGGNSGGGNTLNFSNTSQSTQDMASEALKNTINIKPTLYKNQGERISIYVARDLDFSGVYSIERR
jgi:type IV secretion system protein VirB10